jgi:hypothetical protein
MMIDYRLQQHCGARKIVPIVKQWLVDRFTNIGISSEVH